MSNKLISIRLPENMLKKAKSISSKELFANLNDFIRDSIRKNIEDYQTKKGMAELKKGLGSVKNIKRMNHKEKEKLVEELFRERQQGKDILKEFGLK